MFNMDICGRGGDSLNPSWIQVCSDSTHAGKFWGIQGNNHLILE